MLAETLRFTAATFCGGMIGSFLLLQLMRPLLMHWLDHDQRLWIHRRYYRLSIVLGLLGGVCAILGGVREAGFLLSVLAISHVFANMHLLKAIESNYQEAVFSSGDAGRAGQHAGARRALGWLRTAQDGLHLLQLLTTLYILSLLFGISLTDLMMQ